MKAKIIIGLGILLALTAAIIKGSLGFALVFGILLVLVALPNANKPEKKKLDSETEELNNEIYTATGE